MLYIYIIMLNVILALH